MCVDGDLPGFERYDHLVAGAEAGELDGQREGGWMFYSSGTTGKPKGILPPLLDVDLGAPSFLTMLLKGLFGFTSDVVYLSPAPLYHAAPAGWTVGVQRLGATAVVMERFDPLELLAAVERHRVTHMQLCRMASSASASASMGLNSTMLGNRNIRILREITFASSAQIPQFAALFSVPRLRPARGQDYSEGC